MEPLYDVQLQGAKNQSGGIATVAVGLKQQFIDRAGVPDPIAQRFFPFCEVQGCECWIAAVGSRLSRVMGAVSTLSKTSETYEVRSYG